MEIILYASSVVYGYHQFIAVWLATKYIASWKKWGETGIGRTLHNRSLFGSGLNVLAGVLTGLVAKYVIVSIGVGEK